MMAPVVVPFAAAADELTSVYARILDNPTSAELNIQYAMIAEGRGEFRKALAAYERALINDPGNEAAKRGLQRVRRIIQPPLTQVSVEVGATGETNPRHDGSAGEVLGYASLSVRDERRIGDHRWRTNLGLYGEAHATWDDMNYASATVDTGPLIDLAGTMLTFRPAIGVGTALFDGRLYYGDVNAAATLEGYLNGAYQWVRVRGGYRQFDPSFTASNGFYVDLTGKVTFPNVIHERDIVSISPWLRWSGIAGDPDDGAIDFAPGLYVEGGATVEYAKVLNDAVTAAVNFKASERAYTDIGLGSRQDLLLSPGASLTFTGFFGAQTDLRFDYRYEWNQSTQAAHSYDNHVATVAVVVRR